MWVGHADILILHLVKHCLWSLQLPVLWTLPLAAHCFVSLEAAFIWTPLQFSFQRAAMVWPREHESGGVSLVVILPPGLSFFIRRMGEAFSTRGCGEQMGLSMPGLGHLTRSLTSIKGIILPSHSTLLVCTSKSYLRSAHGLQISPVPGTLLAHRLDGVHQPVTTIPY